MPFYPGRQKGTKRPEAFVSDECIRIPLTMPAFHSHPCEVKLKLHPCSLASTVLLVIVGIPKTALSETQKPKSPHCPRQNTGEHSQDASAVIKGRMPFDHDRRERSTNLGITDLTPAAFGDFCLQTKVTRRHTKVCLKKRNLNRWRNKKPKYPRFDS